MSTATQTAQPTNPAVQPSLPPSWFIGFATTVMKAGSIKFSNLFWVLFAATILFLGSQLSKSRTQVGAAKLPTPSSQEFKNLQLTQSITVVLHKPLTMANGERVTVSDPKTLLQAAVKVKDWQDRELIKQQAGITMLAMLRGTTTPKHPCYQRDRGFCLDMLRRQNGVTSEFGKNRTLRVCKRLQQPDLTSFIASSSARHNPSQIDRFLTLLENGRF